MVKAQWSRSIKSLVHVHLKVQVSHCLGSSVSDADPQSIPRYNREGAGEHLRQPEGVWPGSRVVFRAHFSSPWLTSSLTFSLSVSISLSLPPSHLLSRELCEQGGWKAVLCSIECKLCLCVCVSAFQWLSFLYSSAMQCNYAVLAYHSGQRSKEHVLTSIILYIPSFPCQGPISHAPHREHASTRSVA